MLDAQQAVALQRMQRAVGTLARHGRQEADLVLAQPHEAGGARIEDGVEQAGQATRHARVGAEQAIEFHEADEQAQSRIDV
ncbi:hypothetical protein D3C84_1106480 [compost metagenome]